MKYKPCPFCGQQPGEDQQYRYGFIGCRNPKCVICDVPMHPKHWERRSPSLLSESSRRCPKCGNNKLILATGYGVFTADQEPYEDGKIEEAEILDFDVDDLSAHFCSKCGRIIDIWCDTISMRSS